MGRGTSVSSCTVAPRSGMPGTGSWKYLPSILNDSCVRAIRMMSICSSKYSRFFASSAAWSGLSCEPMDTWKSLRWRISRGTVPRPTPRMPRPPLRLCMRGEVLGEAQRVPLRHHVEHRAEADVLGAGGDPRADEDAVGDDLVALVLEVVLGGPEAVVAEPVGLDRRRRCTSASRPSTPGCRSAGPSGWAGRHRRRSSRPRRRRTLRFSCGRP